MYLFQIFSLPDFFNAFQILDLPGFQINATDPIGVSVNVLHKIVVTLISNCCAGLIYFLVETINMFGKLTPSGSVFYSFDFLAFC